jgi:hypothetical protein
MLVSTSTVGTGAVLLVFALLPVESRADDPPRIGNAQADGRRLQLGSAVRITVSDKYFEDKAKTADLRSHLYLFLNGVRIPDAHPVQTDPENKTLTFNLTRTEASQDAWNAILANFTGFNKDVQIGIAHDDEAPVLWDKQIKLTVIPTDWVFYVSLLGGVSCLALFVWLVRASNIIRDSGPEPGVGQRRPYGLGRTQMAYWFFIVFLSYMLIWVITRDRDVIPGEVLALLGISAGTALGSVLIDTGKRTAAVTELAGLQARVTALNEAGTEITGRLTGAAAANPPPPADQIEGWRNDLAAKRLELTVSEARIRELSQQVGPAQSQGFFKDLVSDAEGVSLHRFQVCVWTLVLSVVFFAEVYNHLAMPKFSQTLLALMGISGATYVGFKFPESQK